MSLPKAFGAIRRAQLRTTPNKKGLPLETITRIRNEHQKHDAQIKTPGGYGDASRNNVGVSQGCAISARRFIIYLGDMIEDYEAISRMAELISRKRTIRDPNAETLYSARNWEITWRRYPAKYITLIPKRSNRKQETLYEEKSKPPENQETPKQMPGYEKLIMIEEGEKKQKEQLWAKRNTPPKRKDYTSKTATILYFLTALTS